ncbi:MAG: sugar ABC transporter permease [Spirochaetales bacterium]|nr:sugar ABC transporter permease [Spirochaetales bacterium]
MLVSRKERIIPYLFLFPAFVGLILFKLYPILHAMISSFQSVSFGAGNRVEWVGFENYAFIFQDPTFWKALRVTLIFTLLVNPFQIIVAFILALLVSQNLRGINFFRTAFFMPITVSLAIASTMWGLMLNPNQGLVNAMIGLVGISPQPFLTSPNQALLSIIFIASWRGVGYWMIFLLAGLQNIPTELYESAMIDGARAFSIFRAITLPLMKRTITFVIVADTTRNFLLFEPMYILTGGGPQGSTNILMFEAFRNVFIYGDRGVGNAIVMVLLALILIFVGIEFRFLRSEA